MDLSLSRSIEVTSESNSKSGLTLGIKFVNYFNILKKKIISVAEIGGYVGMILGISLMDLEQLLHKVLSAAFEQFMRRKFACSCIRIFNWVICKKVTGPKEQAQQ